MFCRWFCRVLPRPAAGGLRQSPVLPILALHQNRYLGVKYYWLNPSGIVHIVLSIPEPLVTSDGHSRVNTLQLCASCAHVHHACGTCSGAVAFWHAIHISSSLYRLLNGHCLSLIVSRCCRRSSPPDNTSNIRMHILLYAHKGCPSWVYLTCPITECSSSILVSASSMVR